MKGMAMDREKSVPADAVPPAAPSAPPKPAVTPASATKKRWWLRGVWALVAVLILIAGIQWYLKARDIVSTDDAYINGHVTFVAPRVGGQVARVLVDDNNRVHKGDLLVQIDKEPYQRQVDVAQAAVGVAQADLAVAQAQARALVGQSRSQRFALEHAIEDVDNQVALLHSRVATLQSQQASLVKAQADYDRGVPALNSGGMTREEFDLRREELQVAQAKVEEAKQGVYQVRVSLGLPPMPASGDDLAQVPADLDQTFSSVRQAEASLLQAASQLGVVDSFDKLPKQLLADFYKRDPEGNIDRIYEQLLKDAPSVKQAEAKLTAAQSDLDQALLNLKYTDIYSEIDGVVTRREVNPGDNVAVGQSLMAVRSLTEIWVDANFKETQLGSLRIGQPVDIEVDMYGRHQTFKGRISGFTMGTGSTLALLPAENATGNFVKVVQRLPVRIELLDYEPDKVPLFIGLSVTPHVHIREAAEGLQAGAVLQPYLPTASTGSATATAPASTGARP
jgi:membrane fusion protein (multidrug efflux system)